MLMTLIVMAAMTATPPSQCPAGQTPRGDLGIRRIACDCTVRAARDGEPANWRFRSLPIVQAVDAPSGAHGVLEPGDEIVAIDGVSLLTPDGGARFANVPPAASVRLTIRRAGRVRDVAVRAGAICSGDARLLERRAPAAPPAPRAGTRSPGGSIVPSGNMSLPWFGWALSCRGCGWEQEQGDAHPRWESSDLPMVHAVQPGGPAEQAGIRAGDRLVGIAGQPITSRDGGSRLGAANPGAPLAVTIERGGRTLARSIVPGPRRGGPSRAPLAPRYRGEIGPASVEVDSADAVSVTLSDDGTELVITTPTTTVRVKVQGTR